MENGFSIKTIQKRNRVETDIARELIEMTVKHGRILHIEYGDDERCILRDSNYVKDEEQNIDIVTFL